MLRSHRAVLELLISQGPKLLCKQHDLVTTVLGTNIDTVQADSLILHEGGQCFLNKWHIWLVRKHVHEICVQMQITAFFLRGKSKHYREPFHNKPDLK